MPHRERAAMLRIMEAAGLLSPDALHLPPEANEALRQRAIGRAERQFEKVNALLAYGGKCMCCGWPHLHQLQLRAPVKAARLRRLGYPQTVEGHRVFVLCQFCQRSSARDPEGLCAHQRAGRR